MRICLVLVALCATACGQDPAPAPVAAGGCLATGDGQLQAELRGALVADLDWKNAQMQCEGGLRPEGDGIRVVVAGPLPPSAGAPARTLRIIFGIDLADSAAGEALALPTNLTIIIDGEGQFFATRGDDKCAVELLRRTPLPEEGAYLERVEARGYCLGPASDVTGNTRVLLPTFAFTALMRNDGEP